MTNEEEEIAQLEAMMVDAGTIISTEIATRSELQHELGAIGPSLTIDWDVEENVIWVEVTGRMARVWEGTASDFFESVQAMLDAKKELDEVEEAE